jgi:hypothetical protein
MKSYKLGFGVLFALIIAVLLGFIAYYLYIRSINDEYLLRYIFNVIIFVGALILIFGSEMWVYWSRRQYIANRLWVHLHVWPLCAAMILFGIAFIISLQVYVTPYAEEVLYYRIRENVETTRLLMNIFWGLVIISHISFIVTIVRSFTLQKESQSNESPGIPGKVTERS